MQALIFETAHRRCGACGVPLVFGERGRVWFMDHIVPIYKGGLTTRANLMPLCRPCHVAKTRPEIQEIRKLRPNTSKRYWQTHAQKDAEIAALRADVGELTKAVVMLFYLTARR